MVDPYDQFTSTLWAFYDDHQRQLPWRQPEADGLFDAYKIMVSEIMLQQTQVTRVISKYQDFLAVFPSVRSVANAPLSAVLQLWSGLGYNRRAKFLWQAAGQLAPLPQPWSYEQLVACPGIGPNTAAAIMAYAYNQARPFVETNIRTVYIHHFFPDDQAVPDKLILETVAQTIDQKRPREFFWALMDYGTHLKQVHGNISRQSKQYVKQSTFAGSHRQLRGAVLRELLEGTRQLDELTLALPDDRLATVLDQLQAEGLIEHHNGYRLSGA